MPRIITGDIAQIYANNLLKKQISGMEKKFLVGGAVRDIVLNQIPHDRDYVIFGATPEKMLCAGYKKVGKNFPVFLDKNGNECALARKETKTGNKHTEFVFCFTTDVSMIDDVQRRDFTCNSLMYDEKNDLIIDLTDGVKDIQNKILRHVNNTHFGEDPLRILRMCRFAAKLDFDIAPETMQIAADMVRKNMLDYITAERIWKEFETAMQTAHFDKFILAMYQCGAWQKLIPDIKINISDSPYTRNTLENKRMDILNILSNNPKLSPLIKFALLLYNVECEAITKISQNLSVPNKYIKFARLFIENYHNFFQIEQLSKEDFILFLEKISGKFKNLLQLINFIRTCRSIAVNYSVNFKQIAQYCLSNYKVQRHITARDLPDFNHIPKDKSLAKHLMQYRISLIKC